MILKKFIIFIIIFVFVMLGNVLNFSLQQKNNLLKQELSKKIVFIYSNNFETIKEISDVIKDNFETYRTIFFNKNLKILQKIEKKLKVDLFEIPILNEINFSLNSNITDELIEEFKLQDYKKYISETVFPNYLKITFNGYVFNEKIKKDFFDICDVYKDIVSININKNYFEENLNKIDHNNMEIFFINILYFFLLFFSIIIYKLYCASNERHLSKIKEKIKVNIIKINYKAIFYNIFVSLLPIISFSIAFYYFLNNSFIITYFELLFYIYILILQILIVIFALFVARIFIKYLDN